MAVAPEEAMINRLTEYFGAPGVPPPPENYWFVYRREGGGWTVTPETAEYVGRMLDLRRTPEWIRFMDVFGSDVRVRTSWITAIEECSNDQRARARAFWQKIQGEGEDPTPCF